MRRRLCRSSCAKAGSTSANSGLASKCSTASSGSPAMQAERRTQWLLLAQCPRRLPLSRHSCAPKERAVEPHEAQDEEARESESSADHRKEIPEGHSGRSSSQAARAPNSRLGCAANPVFKPNLRALPRPLHFSPRSCLPGERGRSSAIAGQQLAQLRFGRAAHVSAGTVPLMCRQRSARAAVLGATQTCS